MIPTWVHKRLYVRRLHGILARSIYSEMVDHPIKSSKVLVKILAFGDSLTTGNTGGTENEKLDKPYTIHLSNLLKENHPNFEFKVDNKGVYGQLVRGEMTSRLPNVLEACGPYDIVIILGGTNDVITPEQGLERTLFEGIQMLHSQVKEHGAKCIGLTIPETDVFYKDLGKNGLSWVKEEGEKIRLKVNEKLRQGIRQDDSAVILCDLEKKFPQQSLSEQDLGKFWSDGLHFTEEGYKKMAEIIYEDMKHFLL
ncbi:uncharacterized protein [Montipora capricornis]|uniref:uncharacterized protein n=1 Tax=Montipora capricornis TaxID=246305 RepID=UPI0035F21C7B